MSLFINCQQRQFAFTCLLVFGLIGAAFAQQDKAARPSPPAQAQATIGNKTVTIDYGAPSVKGREIWGKLVPYGKVWRAGANETTTFTTTGDLQIDGKTLPAGKYAFFVLPTEKDWTLIFNKTIKWGAFSYKEDEDVLRVTVPSTTASKPAEVLTYTISPNGAVTLTWADRQSTFTVK